MTTVTIDGFDFVLSESSNTILVFKGDALADSHHCSTREEIEAVFEKVKASKHVILDCENKEQVKP
ncbi:MAG: hypothetical protein WC365_09270 [Candidatus Babeliales bacterium]